MNWKKFFRLRLSRKSRKKIGQAATIAGLVLVVYLFHQTQQHIAPQKFPTTRPRAVSVQEEPFYPIERLPAYETKPRLVFVIDDIGSNMKYHRELKALGNQVTYAILPQLRYSKKFGDIGKSTGAEVILHLPLEARDGRYPGPGLITTQMDEKTVRSTIDRNLGTVPHHAGVNNHMGSLGTSDPRLMEIILKDLKERGLFFLDSRTSSDSISLGIGKKMGIPILKRDVFLDNEDNQAAVRTRVYELATLARKKGFAIGIGHYRYNTLKVLSEEIPRLKREGFEIVSLRDSIRG